MPKSTTTLTPFHAFMVDNVAAQKKLRDEIFGFKNSPGEMAARRLAKLHTDLLALSVAMNVRYVQEKVACSRNSIAQADDATGLKVAVYSQRDGDIITKSSSK